MKRPTALGIERSLSGQKWCWRDVDGGGSGLQPDDLVTRILLSRGAPREQLADFRRPSLRAFMPDPSIFCDMDRAAARLADAVQCGEAIAVYGDYDVDGATSAALLIRLLRQLGRNARPYIPDRLLEGYGPSAEALVRLKREGADLVVTVDCGAQAFDALHAAHEAGLDVIVVDHHKCSTTNPVALALVNPNRLDESAEAASHAHLAAVGVAFLLAAALVRTLRGRDFFKDRVEPDLIALLDIVALGTVADVAQLKGLNRAFVAQGLKVLGRRQNIGLAALADVARVNALPGAHELGFAFGPRINAGGRVGQADLGVRLLTTEDPAEARALAAELDRFNEERRAIEAAVTEQALEQCEATANAPITIVAGTGWHPGVIGIVAGRLKERFGKPAIVIALGEDGVGKGSGRSIAGVDLGAAVIAARESGYLIAGGGHAMAAGLTVAPDGVDGFAAWLADRLADECATAQDSRALSLDALLAPGGINARFAEAIEEGGPYGHGWPQPRIATGPIRLVKADIVGTGHVRLVAAGEDGRSFKAIAFRAADSDMGQALLANAGGRRFWLAGRVKKDDWAGRDAAELHLDDAAMAD
ncbi:single-stranded-DNA-specific exonuclease RecJ [Sphingomonas lacunae]|uniref:Single-stranded-DNA-specific exonuclease RecJ n=1 Tax=Sphingomonas lacunae TaxID=2698828 RepID=A0A6M4ARE9_9SPHN|nr:single-stranded-DNA-specific exonuclease RecJ [Sphingomonas lacunae]QJQ31615.1 single-stranded-DNA-specific exonuclease RecJ [Sphingomonas lacunae]